MVSRGFNPPSRRRPTSPTLREDAYDISCITVQSISIEIARRRMAVITGIIL
jgi:hypothetical protein